MTIITLNEAREAALAALAAEGDHIYQMPLEEQGTCTYSTPDGAPSCLVGHVAYRLAPDQFQHLFEMEWSGYVEERGGQDYTPETKTAGQLDGYTLAALAWLAWAQTQQDGGTLWSEAMRFADERIIDHDDDDFLPEEVEYVESIKKWRGK